MDNRPSQPASIVPSIKISDGSDLFEGGDMFSLDTLGIEGNVLYPFSQGLQSEYFASDTFFNPLSELEELPELSHLATQPHTIGHGYSLPFPIQQEIGTTVPAHDLSPADFGSPLSLSSSFTSPLSPSSFYIAFSDNDSPISPSPATLDHRFSPSARRQPPLSDHEPHSAAVDEMSTMVPRQVTSTAMELPGQCRTSSSLNENFPPPPDLTPYIIKCDDRYVAGGSFGDVYRCLYRHHDGILQKEVAVKAFRFKLSIDGDVNNKSTRMLHRELGIWRRLNHMNVVPFLGIAYGFGMHGAISLVSLWMPNESLHHYIAKHDDHLDVGHRLQLLLDIANGLHYLHSLSVVHGDLNSNNVLLDTNHTARLSDFGYASLVGNIPEALSYLQRSTVRPGALRWIAPEQVDPEEAPNGTTKTDIYSFGCINLQVLSGKQPWSEVHSDAAVVLRLAKGHKPGRPASLVLEDSHWNFIQRCWSSIEERPTTEVIVSTIQQFLSHCPRLRILNLIKSWESQADLGVKPLSSLDQDMPERPNATLTKNDQSVVSSSDEGINVTRTGNGPRRQASQISDEMNVEHLRKKRRVLAK